MEKKIEYYLPYYIGQYMIYAYPDGRKSEPSKITGFIAASKNYEAQLYFYRSRWGMKELNKSNWKLALRPLSDMTDEEMRELHLLWYGEWNRDIYNSMFHEVKFKPKELKRHNLHGTGVGYSAFDKTGKHIQTGTLSFSRLNSDQFHYLLKQGFDLFGLIEAGLAIDKTKEGK